MYTEYWGLTEKPFENTADPKFIYYSSQHQEAFSRLTYAINEQKGAAFLTGVFGCGKTVIAQAVLMSLSKGKFETAFVVNPQLSHAELLREVVYDLGLKDNLPTLKTDILHALNEMLRNNMDNGKNTVVFIDEAHLINDILIFEELRLLLNLQHKNKFLLTLILLGQPELKDKINNIKQFQQRISIKHHLGGLNHKETESYIQYRLKVAGTDKPLFDGQAIKLIFEQSGGIPRRINQICDMSLLVGMSRKLEIVDRKTVDEVIEDLEA
jgi:general secretion pathway protein A